MLGMRVNADLRTLCFTASFFLVAYYNWQAFYNRSWLTFAPTFALECILSFMGAVTVHNAIHTPVFWNYRVNKLFQIVLTLTYGHPVTCYVPGHNLSHHHHTQKPEDVMRTSKLRFKWHFLNGLFFFVRIGVDMLGSEASYFEVQRRKGHPIYKQMVLEKTCLWTLYGVLAVLDWKKLLFCMILPHTFAKFCIISLNLLQHDGADEDTEFNHSRNFTGGIINFICCNNGFHTVHHNHPGMHWSLTKDYHYKHVAPKMHPNLDEPNILAYIFRTFIFPGRRLHYSGKPVQLPPVAEDKPWFYASEETYSTTEKMK